MKPEHKAIITEEFAKCMEGTDAWKQSQEAVLEFIKWGTTDPAQIADMMRQRANAGLEPNP